MGMSTTECRVCLQDGGTVPIFGNDDDRPDISLEVRVFGGVPLSKDDEFPKGLCEACFRLLENAVSFRKSALLANIELQRRRVQQSSTKGLEADDEDTHTKPKVSTNTNKIKDDTSDGISLSDDHGSYFGSDDESNIKDISSEKLTSQEQYDSNSKTCSSVLETKAIKMNNVTENCPESIKLPSPDYLEDHLGSTHGIASDSSQLSTFNRPSSLSSEIGRPLKRSRWCNMCKIRHLVCPQFCQQNRTTRNPKPAEGTLNTVKEKNLMCETCGKLFNTTQDLRRHRDIHNDFPDLPYKCDHCPYRGREKCSLIAHLRKHVGDYRFVCAQCGKRFIQRGNLQRHTLVHNKEQVANYHCDSCKKGFYYKCELQNHIKIKHTRISSTYVCNICGNSYAQQKGLRNHCRKVHKQAKRQSGWNAVYLKIKKKDIEQLPAPLEKEK